MKTIAKTFFKRLQAQLEEANFLNLKKESNSLDVQLKKYAKNIRENDHSHSYSYEEMKFDVNNSIWDAMITVSDFLGGAEIDAEKLQKIADQLSEELIKSIKVSSNIPDGVGAYEPKTPGEERLTTIISVEEDD